MIPQVTIITKIPWSTLLWVDARSDMLDNAIGLINKRSTVRPNVRGPITADGNDASC